MNASLIRKIDKNNFQKDYFFSTGDIGDWAGDETQALNQLNWIMKTIELTLNPFAVAPAPAYVKNWVWKDWGGDTRILDADNEAIVDYVYNLLSGYISRQAIAA